MKIRYSFQTVLVVFSLCLIPLLSGCRKEVENVVIKPNTLTLFVGDKYQLGVEVLPEKAPQDVKWSSSNSRVAAVDGNGLLTAISSGSCKVTVRAGSFSATCVVRVNGKPAEYGFTVGEQGRRVQFSPGNLQYMAISNTWRFAEHQYDYVGDGGIMGGNVPGSDNCLIDSAYEGWIDLFGWTTSGWNDENNTDHLHYQPWSSSYEINDGSRTGYGPSEENENAAAGTRYDWGVNNAIYNPLTEQMERAGTWRTLTSIEWNYLLEERSTITDFRYAKAKVNGVNGLVIFPDEWRGEFVFQNPNREKGCLYEDNCLNDSDWLFCEAEGCVFLPAAGRRQGSVAISVNSEGRYWTISRYRYNAYMGESGNLNGKDLAFVLYFNESTLLPSTIYIAKGVSYRYYGCSVRLVKDIR